MIHDLKHAWRAFVRMPAFTITAVLTLALGIGANVAIFSIVDGVLLRPLPLADPDRLVVIWETHPTLPVPFMVASPPHIVDWRSEHTLFDEVGGFTTTRLVLADAGVAEQIVGASVWGGLLPALGIAPAVGRFFEPAEYQPGAPRVVILSDGLWRRRFGADRSIVGKPIILSGSDYTVVGIMPERFNFLPSITIEGKPPLERSQFWIPQRIEDPNQMRGAHFLTTIARLKPGVSIGAAEARLHANALRLWREYPADEEGWDVRVVPLMTQATAGIRSTLLLLFGAVVFVLLLTCTNVASLLLARATGRRTEMAVRAALGASRARIARQLLTESAVLSLMGSAAGLLVGAWGVRFARAFGPASIVRLDEARVDVRVVVFTIAAAAVVALLCGAAPILQLLRGPAGDSLKSRTGAAGPAATRMRSGLVVAEIAFALVLLIGGVLLIQSFVRLRGVNPGFSPRHAMTFRVALPPGPYGSRESRVRFIQDLLRQLAASTGVDAAGAIDAVPIGEDRQGTSYYIEGTPPLSEGRAPHTGFSFPTPGYFEAVGLPILRGRGFTPFDARDSKPVVIVNQALARQAFGTANPVGRQMRVGFNSNTVREIVGVVADEHHTGLDKPASPNVYVPYTQNNFSGSLSFVVRTNADLATATALARNAVRAVDPGLAIYNARTMEAIVSASIATERFSTTLLGAFALAALLLAVIGVYGVTDQVVSQRTHEIGIRLALGASPRQIAALVLGSGARLCAWGIGIGLAGALVTARALSGLLFGVSALDPRAYVGMSIVLALASLWSCGLPARRASRVEPTVALREN
jgi:putative ABC transport system permease protein